MEQSLPPTLAVPTYTFTTRAQHLNRIDAVTRSSEIFLSRLAKFFQLRGSFLQTPVLECRTVDLYSLHHVVARLGGYEKVSEETQWTEVAKELHYKDIEPTALELLEAYKTIILPYLTVVKGFEDTNPPPFVKGVTQEPEVHAFNMSRYEKERINCVDLQIQEATSKLEEIRGNVTELPAHEQEHEDELKKLEKVYLSTGLPDGFENRNFDQDLFKVPEDLRRRTTRRGTKRKRSETTERESEKTTNNDFAFKKPGLSVSGLIRKLRRQKILKKLQKKLKRLKQRRQALKKRGIVKKRGLGRWNKKIIEIAYLLSLKSSKKVCQKCKKCIGQALFKCTLCHMTYHLRCIVPEMSHYPQGDWHCTQCIAREMKNYQAPFNTSLDDRVREYNLQEFRTMAKNTKRMFFCLKNIEKPSSEKVEQKFWQIVGEKNSTVDTVVEYGADFIRNQGTDVPSHTAARMELSHLISPSNRTPLHLSPRILYEKLIYHPWNLNNIAENSTSALSYFKNKISRMQAPWMNIGMIFSTFGWHCEPHWCYNINHLHTGDSKTWYAVPGEYAEKFEETMKELAPELFETQPDTLLLHDCLVNPKALMEKGVPVYRLNQTAGEFVITFPRAYHCGFDHGFNVSEAVNFAPADWIKIGRKCVEEYALLKTNSLFSHDELMFRIAKASFLADVRIATAAYHDLYYSIKSELKLRQFVVGQWGCTEEMMSYNIELYSDYLRRCDYCKSTIYMSAVMCKCCTDDQRMVCIKHYDKLCTTCTPQNHYLIERRTSKAMFLIFKYLLVDVVDPYEKWVTRMRSLLHQNPVIGYSERKVFGKLMQEAEQNLYLSQSLLYSFNTVLYGPSCRLRVFGKNVSRNYSDAYKYLVHYLEHILDVGQYTLCSNSVFKLCKCLTDFRYPDYDKYVYEIDSESGSSSSSTSESGSSSSSTSESGSSSSSTSESDSESGSASE
ncbi:lysine-specific demethylase lid-like [Nilaparvata lugens]|uniref:lysine-specific demethylase lid-like n=1 Tax=Nilaparvata lugens TaxID=108931 RepID=UPI00193E37F8|nr:lysine-specific demethylase lid-like [Nilaparvata lugens]